MPLMWLLYSSPLGSGDLLVNKTDKILTFEDLLFLWGRTDSKQDK